MHRSVLENAFYVKFSAENTVEVVAMEEMDRALEEKSEHVKTYKGRDAYGAEEEFLVTFPGLTIDELAALSASAATRYMEGGRIPYTAIVDPFTLDEMEGLKGLRKPQELIEIIRKHGATLSVRHGKGVERRSWNALRTSLAEIDNLLAETKISKAIAVQRRLAAEHAREGEEVSTKVASAEKAILRDAARRLDDLEAAEASPKRTAELRELARALQEFEDQALSVRAAALAAASK